MSDIEVDVLIVSHLYLTFSVKCKFGVATCSAANFCGGLHQKSLAAKTVRSENITPPKVYSSILRRLQMIV